MLAASSDQHRDIAQITGRDGRFALRGLEAGQYFVMAVADQAETVQRAGRHVTLGDGETVDITLRLGMDAEC